MSCKTRANSKQQILSMIKLNPKDRQLIKVVTVVVPVLREEVKKTYSPMQKCQGADLYPPNTHVCSSEALKVQDFMLVLR